MSTTAPDKSGYTEAAPLCAADINRAKFEYTKEQTALKLDNERWKNRRRMAWISLWATMIVTAAMMFAVPETRIEKLDEVVVWFYVSMASIIGVYIGSATFSDIKSLAEKRSMAKMGGGMYGATPYDAYDQAASIVDNPDQAQ